MDKPIIGILSNIKLNKDSAFISRVESFVYEKYITAVEKNGGIPLIIHASQDSDIMIHIIKMCNGLIFPGGDDIDPKLYGENPSKNLGIIFPRVDKSWYISMRYAIDNDIPTLGICKGMQMINVVAGGTLYQDIYEQIGDCFQHDQKLYRDNLMHRVNIDKDSKLSRILGVDCMFTNTLHHQSVKQIGKGFRKSAQTEDGIIEAIENKSGNIIGVQWHPEELLENEERMNYLFKNLCECSLNNVEVIIGKHF